MTESKNKRIEIPQRNKNPREFYGLIYETDWDSEGIIHNRCSGNRWITSTEKINSRKAYKLFRKKVN